MAIGGYLLLALAGLFPVGPPYAPTAKGVEVFVIVTSPVQHVQLLGGPRAARRRRPHRLVHPVSPVDTLVPA
jgi:hypothetical protein